MKKFLSVCCDSKIETPPPIWLMRQAGRYLPEYRAVREKAGSFLNLVYTPDLAAEVTIQPIRRFHLDAAILFSDILVVPQALGADLKFEAGEGPSLTPVRNTEDLKRLSLRALHEHLAPIYETVRLVRSNLKTEKLDHAPLIGFAGGPFTCACYMVQGNGRDHDFEIVRRLAYEDPTFFDGLMDLLTTATMEYLRAQIQAGAEAVQIFESWAGAASGLLFNDYVLVPTRKIVRALRSEFPQVPIIGFPRGAGNRLGVYTRTTGVSMVGADYNTDLYDIGADLGLGFPVQGNVDPIALLVGGAALDRAAETLLFTARGTPHVVNLGHGILPETPIHHVEQFIERIRRG